MIIRFFFKIVLCLIVVALVIFLALSYDKDPEKISYGVTFSKTYSDELNLPWHDVFISILDDLRVKKLRLVAYWPMVEPEKDRFNFEELDFQVKEAQKRNTEVILAVGRRLPRWPECHIPEWAKKLSSEEQKKETFSYLRVVVERYQNYENVKYWQVENEPFLSVFAKEHCGELDKNFLKEEIVFVKKIDRGRPILVTDSGNLGLWQGAWQAGDAFGTSVYMYLWNPTVGEIKSVYRPSFYKFKKNLMSLLFGSKENFLIELSLEPWLLQPIAGTSIEAQISRMDLNKFNEVVSFAEKTGFEEQYLWGVEWWYWMKEKDHPEYWQRAKEIFSPNTSR